ncbi:MAG TPA: DHH family phosphoesterase [Candidatus Thermoplasmatota archaeon]|nr:DHH family phosphoesterase [Candidatus Thermoplasmatota archaeon]
MDPVAVEGFLRRAAETAEAIRRAPRVHVVSHIDADGLTSASIAVSMLRRAGIPHDLEFVKSITPSELERIRAAAHPFVLFTDLGSGSADVLKDWTCAVADHHQMGADFATHLNPRLFGLGGESCSGAGSAYFIARALDPANVDLAALAVVGAVGDLQDADACRLTGLNRVILEDGRRAGVVEWRLDARWFGRETRPVYKMLQYADDPLLPGVSGSDQAAMRFVQDQGVALRERETWRRWTQLSLEERRAILSAAAVRVTRTRGAAEARRMIGEVYVLSREAPGTPLRDAKEFATLLNSTARYGEGPTGLAVCLGDRDAGYRKALSLLRGHRQNLVSGVQLAQLKVERREIVQWFDAGESIRDTIVGIVAGMMYGAGASRELPIVGFARASETETKVSARAPRELVLQGVVLSQAVGEAAREVGGSGGGHDGAAGATIPLGKEPEFLERLESVLKRQLSKPVTVSATG